MTEAPQPYADVRETHSGVVLLLGDLAYKLKKPIRLAFLDFSTSQRRLAVCRREVELNRRLAPDVYLGVAMLDRPDGAPEPLVMMRRMPDARRLSRILEEQGDAVDLRALARLLARFHGAAPRSPQIAFQGRHEEVRARWRRNLTEAQGVPGSPIPADLLARIRERSERYLAGRAVLFEERIAQGKVVDGHGDLLADDIFVLPDGPRVLDCLEFDDRLRHLDQIDDLACLAMDLLRLGHPEAASRLLHDYAEFSGDHPPRSLVHHYIAYRAFMRAKVTALRLREPDADRHQASTEDPVSLSTLALHHLDTATVRMVLVGGAPGTGKSTLAGFLGRRLGFDVLSSDTLRKELAGIDPGQSASVPFETGIYTPGWTARTYAEMLRRAELLLVRGESVILDASWRDTEHRAAAARLAERTSTELVQLRCELPPEAAAERMHGRLGASDADEHIAAMMRERSAAWPGSVVVDTSQVLAAVVDAAAAIVLDAARSARGGSVGGRYGDGVTGAR